MVTFSTVKKPDGSVAQPLFGCNLDDTLWTSEAEAVAHALKKHFDTFYKAERTAASPPKGTYTFVAQCGMSGVILHRQGADKREVSSVFWLNLLVAALLSALLLAAAPLLVWFNREPGLGALVPWAVASFFLTCVAAPLRTLAQRDLKIGRAHV